MGDAVASNTVVDPEHYGAVRRVVPTLDEKSVGRRQFTVNDGYQ
jgi:hypothetical protein